jgi:hypothetical protein
VFGRAVFEEEDSGNLKPITSGGTRSTNHRFRLNRDHDFFYANIPRAGCESASNPACGLTRAAGSRGRDMSDMN